MADFIFRKICNSAGRAEGLFTNLWIIYRFALMKGILRAIRMVNIGMSA